MSTALVIENAAIATVDGAGREYARGHLVAVDGRIAAVGEGPAPAGYTRGDLRRVDGRGCLLTPGLVNTHHHLYQWATRGYAADDGLFDWLSTLYPVWGGLDADITHAAASAGLARLAATGCTTAADHHYVFPRSGGDTFGALVAAGQRVGLRLHAVRGSMDRGRSSGGLPPEEIVETLDEATAGTERALERFHDPSPDSRVRVAVGPCSPFSVSRDLMSRAASLARAAGVRLHTHLAETADEERRCQEELGLTPIEYAERLGWLGEDVWLAHAVHLCDDAVKRVAATGTGVAHCPTSNGRLGSGIAPVRPLLDAGAAVGLGVDGAASNEDCGMVEELHQALLLARLRDGPRAFSTRDALRAATLGGARCLGRQDEIGSLEPGKLADIALWRVDGLGQAGIEDRLAALVLGPRPPLSLLLVGGDNVVANGELTTASEGDIAGELRDAARAIAKKVEER
jgi:cytosine/adenosine deaminase-related metal-dependent hydrolase